MGLVEQRQLLLVDDDIDVRRALGRLLRRTFEVTTTDNPVDAVAMIADGRRFLVIVSDLMMPGMRGDELHASILQIDPLQGRRMVFMTGGAAHSSEERLRGQGMPVLYKPVNGCELIATIDTVLRCVDEA